MAGSNGFTPTEKRIMDKLADGLPHTREELLACLEDSEAEWTAASMHISNCRKKLVGMDIVPKFLGRYGSRAPSYMLVRLMSSPYDGRTS